MDSTPTPTPRTRLLWPEYKEVGADYIGEAIDGRYKIIRRLAKGGMAHVFLAKDPTRRCLVALKLLHRTSPDARRRFEAEAQVLSNFQHPHVVRAIAYGHTPDGQPYMALEYLDGETLSQRLARGPLPWREAAELGAQVAGALHALHRIGVIHRDIKPDNIMLAIGADRAAAKVVDLGLASVGTPYHEAQQSLFVSQVTQRHKTQVGWKIGTPAYLPPEAGLCDAEPRLDVYSLGVTLYQLCTQRLPDDDVQPIPDAPADLSRLLRAAIEPDVDDRLPTADHLRRGLEAILAVHPRTPERTHLFGGCYDRLELIGVGANAAVFRGSDRELEREVAIKVLRQAEPSEDAVIRFRRAAKILSAVRHSNIPQIHHFGVDQGQRFAVTELCSGVPASDLTRPDKHLRPDEAMIVGGQLASALAAVHAAGVVYRDLHVGNVLIARTDPPHAWIYDFDQSQVSPEFYARLTGRWTTPPEERVEPVTCNLQRMDYAAPEVRAGAAFTTASDVYALGLLLYRLLTGLRPFAVGGEMPVPARKVCPACSPGLDRLLLSMLSADPGHRPTLHAVQQTLADELAELEAEREAELEAAREAAREVERDAAREREAAREHEAEDGGSVNKSEARETEGNLNGKAAHEPEAEDRAEGNMVQDGEAARESKAAGEIEAEPAAPTSASVVDEGTAMRPRLRRDLFVAVFAAAFTSVAAVALIRATGHGELPDPVRPPLAAHTAPAATLDSDPGVPGGATQDASPDATRDPGPGGEGAGLAHDPGHGDETYVSGHDGATHDPGLGEATHEPGLGGATIGPGPDPVPASGAGSRRAHAPRRGAVTTDEATSAARRAIVDLRTCKDVPDVVTAEIDIVRGRGVVTGLNFRPLAPDDPRFAWHSCAQPILERVRFPVSDTAGRVRVRLPLR